MAIKLCFHAMQVPCSVILSCLYSILHNFIINLFLQVTIIKQSISIQNNK
jgi:hypothetical protein